MAARICAVGDAIVALLEAGEAAGAFAVAIQTERVWDSRQALEDLSVVSVLVIPVRCKYSPEAEETYDDEMVFDIIVRKKFGPSQITDGDVDRQYIDQYVELLETIQEYLAYPTRRRLTNYQQACWIGPRDTGATRDLGIVAPVSQDDLVNLKQYTGQLRVMYSVGVDVT
jgi:hypothetical protein